jgi:selenocysteine lyase/cysteine desulfurase
MSAFPQHLWRPETIYLNTASYGLPPDPAWDAMQAVLEDYRGGRTTWEPWIESVERSRAAFAAITRAPVERVTVGANISGLIAQIATSLPDGTRVLAADVEFESLIFPFLAQPGIDVRFVALAELAESVDGDTDVVAVSAVQSSSGEVAALDDIAAAARDHGALTVVDATHAIGWLPLDATRFDALACAAYKWLMCPRGTAFMVLDPALAERIVPSQAGWFATDDPTDATFGPPLRLAPDARRFDTSPAWFSWVATAPTLELIHRLGVDAIHAHDLALADRFRAGLGLPPGDSAIVTTDAPGARERLERAGIMAAAKLGRLRASFHVYNTEADVDAALDALHGS